MSFGSGSTAVSLASMYHGLLEIQHSNSSNPLQKLRIQSIAFQSSGKPGLYISLASDPHLGTSEPRTLSLSEFQIWSAPYSFDFPSKRPLTLTTPSSQPIARAYSFNLLLRPSNAAPSLEREPNNHARHAIKQKNQLFDETLSEHEWNQLRSSELKENRIRLLCA